MNKFRIFGNDIWMLTQKHGLVGENAGEPHFLPPTHKHSHRRMIRLYREKKLFHQKKRRLLSVSRYANPSPAKDVAS